jgi:hypothetical protein
VKGAYAGTGNDADIFESSRHRGMSSGARPQGGRLYPRPYCGACSVADCLGPPHAAASRGRRILRGRNRGRTLLEYFVHRYLLPAVPGPGRRAALPAQALRPPPLGTPRAAVGRRAHQPAHHGHAALLDRPGGPGRLLPPLVDAGADRRPPAELRGRGVGPSLRALLPLRQPVLPLHQAASPVPSQPEGRRRGLRPHQRVLGHHLHHAHLRGAAPSAGGRRRGERTIDRRPAGRAARTT